MDEKQIEIEESAKRIEQLIAKINGDGESAETSTELNYELEIQQRLLQFDKDDNCENGPGVARRGSESTSGSQFDNNSVMIGMILEWVDERDLLNCRLISKLWNEGVVRYLTQMPDSINDNVHAHFIWHRKFHTDFNKLATNARTGEKTLQDFYLLLEESKHPELLLKVVDISRKIVKSFNPSLSLSSSPTNILECEQILGKFGKHVKRLVIEGDKDFIVSSRCLGQSGFCPNIQQLSFTIQEDCGDGDFLQPFLPNIGVLKLKKLEFSYSGWAVSNSKSINALTMFFRAIVQNSCELEHLKIQTIDKEESGASGWRWNTQSFLQVLQSLPERMRNLKKFYLQGEILDNLPTLCLIQFGSRLKTVDLVEQDNSYLFQKTKDERGKWMGKFLNLVSGSLECFTLNTLKSKRVVLSLTDLPFMPRLIQFTLSALYEQLDIVKLLQKFPSLRRLSMSGMSTFKELLLQGGNSNPCLVHGQLERINVGLTKIEIPTSVHIVNVSFPRLSRLEIQLVHPSGTWNKSHTLWLENSFRFISQMRNLQDLSIKFSVWGEYEELEVDLRQAFLYLKETPKLVELRLVGQEEDNFKGKMITAALPALFGAPKLQRIIFNCFPNGIKNYFFKRRITQLIEEFANINIDLRI